MKTIEIAARLFGRQFLKLSFTIKEIEMPKPQLVQVEIIDSFGIGYANGTKPFVTPEEAKKLIEAKKAKPVTTPKKETATAKSAKVEKR